MERGQGRDSGRDRETDMQVKDKPFLDTPMTYFYSWAPPPVLHSAISELIHPMD